MAIDNIQELLQAGIQAAKQGNRSGARRLLLQVIEQAPNNELAWIWLASVAETIGQRREYLERVLAINPDNQRAKQALEKIKQSSSAVAETPRPAPEPRRSRPTVAEREALLKQQKPRRQHRRNGRLSRRSFNILAILALMLIGLGFYLFWQQTQDTEPEATPTLEELAQGTEPHTAVPPTATSGLRYITPTPANITSTPYTQEVSPPTWTPTATWTPTVEPTATRVPPSLSDYTLLFTRQNSSQTISEFYTITADGTGETRIELSVSPADAGINLQGVFDAVYSPNGTQIVFSARLQAPGDATTTYQDLFVAPAEGGEMRRLTTLQAPHVESATWSLTNDRIAFASDAEGDYNIYIVSIDGGTPVRITPNTGVDRDPDWSPVDDTIAFATDIAGQGELEIYSMTSTGEELKRLTDNTNDSYAPAWSHDGKYIAFVSTRLANNDLYVMEADGRGEHALLVRDVEAEEYDPAWSPDSNWIAFSSNREGAALDIFLIKPDGSKIEQITLSDNTVNSRYPDWQPQ